MKKYYTPTHQRAGGVHSNVARLQELHDAKPDFYRLSTGTRIVKPIFEHSPPFDSTVFLPKSPASQRDPNAFIDELYNGLGKLNALLKSIYTPIKE